eukprot:COSAG03_NODE_929_length_5276_cov_15.813599_8_plen_86_part_00
MHSMLRSTHVIDWVLRRCFTRRLRQAGRQADRQAGRQTGRQAGRQSQSWSWSQRGRGRDREKDPTHGDAAAQPATEYAPIRHIKP